MGERGPGNNVIYFDQHYHEDRSEEKALEIYKDTELFKSFTSGAFILTTTTKQLNMVLEQIEEYQTECEFDIITTGSGCQKVMDLLEENDFTYLIKRVCIFTYHPDEYYEMMGKYDLIQGVFFSQEEVLKFLAEGENTTQKFSTLQIVTLKDYEDRFSFIHEIIANHYGNNSRSEYEKAIQKAKYFMDNPGNYDLKIDAEKGETQKESMLKALSLFKDIDKNYELIINNYTKEKGSIYKDFNYLLLRLNKKGIEGFGWFMAGLMYSMDKYATKSCKGLKTNQYLYRGMRLDVIEVLNYERMIGQIITFPSFLSTSLIVEKAADPEHFGGRKVAIKTRKKTGKFSVVFTLHYRNNENVLYNTVNFRYF